MNAMRRSKGTSAPRFKARMATVVGRVAELACGSSHDGPFGEAAPLRLVVLRDGMELGKVERDHAG
jgi:hypothetical protein